MESRENLAVVSEHSEPVEARHNSNHDISAQVLLCLKRLYDGAPGKLDLSGLLAAGGNNSAVKQMLELMCQQGMISGRLPKCTITLRGASTMRAAISGDRLTHTFFSGSGRSDGPCDPSAVLNVLLRAFHENWQSPDLPDIENCDTA